LTFENAKLPKKPVFKLNIDTFDLLNVSACITCYYLLTKC